MITVSIDTEKIHKAEDNLTKLRSAVAYCVLWLDRTLQNREHLGENDDVNDRVLLENLCPTITVKDLKNLRNDLASAVRKTGDSI